MPVYQLSPHVHACLDQDQVVLLDLNANRYWGLPPAFAATEGVEVNGLPAPAQLSGAALATLARRGLVEEVATPTRAHWRERPSARSAARLPEAMRVRAGDVAAFAASCLWAEAIVRRGALKSAAAWIGRRKARAPLHGGTLERTALFAALRPWWPRARVCLFDSLALARFALSSGSACDLVFAVRARPFAAHCWVEWRGEALNDFYDPHASFTPILRL